MSPLATSLSKIVLDRSMLKMIVISLEVTEEDRRDWQNFNASHYRKNYCNYELFYH